jgi:hypothetical protein
MNWVRHSPPDIGGVDATSKRSREASFKGADGVVGNGTSFEERIPKNSAIATTPSAPLRRLRIFILGGAATPPISGGELQSSHSFTPSMTVFRLFHEKRALIERPYNIRSLIHSQAK